jgi:hypothetical protein
LTLRACQSLRRAVKLESLTG